MGKQQTVATGCQMSVCLGTAAVMAHVMAGHGVIRDLSVTCRALPLADQWPGKYQQHGEKAKPGR